MPSASAVPESRQSARPARALYGRESELGRIVAEFERVVADGRPGVVFLTGEGGLGKTRFLLEAENLVRRTRPDAAVAYGRALAQHSENNGFQPVREAMADLCYELDQHESHPMLARLGRSLKQTAPDWLEAVPAVGNLLKAAALTVSGTLDGERPASLTTSLMAQFCGLVEDLVQEAPLVLCLDDLHWADASTVDLIYALTQTITRGPFLLVCAYRAADLQLAGEAAHPLRETLLRVDRYTDVTRIELARLGGEEVGRLVAESLERPGAPALLADLLEITAGNPLFLHEYLGLLIDRLGRGRASAEYRSVLAEVLAQTPRRVEAVIEERLSKLTRDENRALEVAAVLGPVFDPADVLALADLDAPSTRASLRALCRRHALIHPVPGAQPARYSFHHVIVRQVLEARLAEADPFDHAGLHAAAADLLRGSGTRDLATLERIAHHSLSAGGGAQRLRDAHDAAEAAWHLGLAHETLRLITPATGGLTAAVLAEVRDRATAAIALRLRAHNAVADHEGAVALHHALAARGCWPSAPNVELALARAERMVNDWAGTRDRLTALFGDSRLGDDERGEALLLLGQVELCGLPPDAACALRTFRAAEEHGVSSEIASQIAGHIGLSHLVLGETAACFDALHRSVTLAERTNNPIDTYEAVHWLSKAEIACLRLDDGLASVERLRRISASSGVASQVPFHQRDRSRLLGLTGDAAGAAAAFVDYLQAVALLGSPRLLERCLATLACQLIELRSYRGDRLCAEAGDRAALMLADAPVDPRLPHAVTRVVAVTSRARRVDELGAALAAEGLSSRPAFDAAEAIFRFDIADLRAVRAGLGRA